jgi:hypothetical protein
MCFVGLDATGWARRPSLPILWRQRYANIMTLARPSSLKHLEQRHEPGGMCVCSDYRQPHAYLLNQRPA